MKAYLANGLFSLGDRMLNDLIANELRVEFEGLELYVPQENGEINDKNSYADSKLIAKADTDKLKEADFLVAVLDGVEIDSGVACEIGKFSTTGKPIFGLFTDIRQHGRFNAKKLQALVDDGLENQFIYRNLYVVGVVKENGMIASSIDELIKGIKERW